MRLLQDLRFFEHDVISIWWILEGWCVKMSTNSSEVKVNNPLNESTRTFILYLSIIISLNSFDRYSLDLYIIISKRYLQNVVLYS